MTRNNIFDGDSFYAIFAGITYKRLMSRRWVTYADIMAEYVSLDSAQKLSCAVTKYDNYGELKKAFSDVRKAINEKYAESFEEEGNNRNKRFRYIGKDEDPLVEMRNAKTIKNLKQYWQFCQDSAGFFPTSWLEYFFKDCHDLLTIKKKRQKGEVVLSASLDRMLTNIELLPLLYEAIIHKQVLSIVYQPYDKPERTLLFHPHYLKEFNGRWHLFGHAVNLSPEFGYNIALDRICERPREIKQDFIPAPPGFYTNFFQHIVGVSHSIDEVPQQIQIRAHKHHIFKLTETKPIHHSQKTITPYEQHEDGEYGEFTVYVEVNNEFIGRILQMGADLEIVSPVEVRETIKERVIALANMYESGQTNVI